MTRNQKMNDRKSTTDTDPSMTYTQTPTNDALANDIDVTTKVGTLLKRSMDEADLGVMVP